MSLNSEFGNNWGLARGSLLPGRDVISSNNPWCVRVVKTGFAPDSGSNFTFAAPAIALLLYSCSSTYHTYPSYHCIKNMLFYHIIMENAVT